MVEWHTKLGEFKSDFFDGPKMKCDYYIDAEIGLPKIAVECEFPSYLKEELPRDFCLHKGRHKLYEIGIQKPNPVRRSDSQSDKLKSFSFRSDKIDVMDYAINTYIPPEERDVWKQYKKQRWNDEGIDRYITLPNGEERYVHIDWNDIVEPLFESGNIDDLKRELADERGTDLETVLRREANALFNSLTQ